jgi:hypothetical protein
MHRQKASMPTPTVIHFTNHGVALFLLDAERPGSAGGLPPRAELCFEKRASQRQGPRLKPVVRPCSALSKGISSSRLLLEIRPEKKGYLR